MGSQPRTAIRLSVCGSLIAALVAVMGIGSASASPSKCVRISDSNGNQITEVCVPMP
ncbi:MAG: hypothetical protein ABR549_14705 [Mycobacteriales bacterium]